LSIGKQAGPRSDSTVNDGSSAARKGRLSLSDGNFPDVTFSLVGSSMHRPQWRPGTSTFSDWTDPHRRSGRSRDSAEKQ
jgi:hypothetical protein